jgi:hypothetical protein
MISKELSGSGFAALSIVAEIRGVMAAFQISTPPCGLAARRHPWWCPVRAPSSTASRRAHPDSRGYLVSMFCCRARVAGRSPSTSTAHTTNAKRVSTATTRRAWCVGSGSGAAGGGSAVEHGQQHRQGVVQFPCPVRLLVSAGVEVGGQRYAHAAQFGGQGLVERAVEDFRRHVQLRGVRSVEWSIPAVTATEEPATTRRGPAPYRRSSNPRSSSKWNVSQAGVPYRGGVRHIRALPVSDPEPLPVGADRLPTDARLVCDGPGQVVALLSVACRDGG